MTESNWLLLVKFPAALLLFLMAFHSVNAQNAITGGTTLKVLTGTTVVSTEATVINSDAVLNNAGTLVLKKNLVNQNSGVNSLGSGKIVFSGSVAQSISGQNVIEDMEVNNSAGLILSGTNRVNGILTLTNGIMALGVNNLLLGPAATIAGTPSGNNMVDASGIGQMQKEFPAGFTGSFTFPVGNTAPTPGYSPVTLTFNSGTFEADNHIGVNLANTTYPGAAGSYLKRYWNITPSAITGFSCNTTFQYLPTDVVGTESDIFCFKVNPAPFTAYNAANTSTHSIDAHGLSSFGTFTGNLGDAAIPPAIRSLQDKIIVSGMVQCADANQTLLIAGNGTSYLVKTGGNVTHIAGQNIIYFPGTKVEPGGWMHGYISTVFCSPYSHPGAAPVAAGIENQEEWDHQGNTLFKIYPNPTTGKVTLELSTEANLSEVEVAIFGVRGEKVLNEKFPAEHKYSLSLSGRPVGIYFIRVISGNRAETAKIIKQ